MFFFANVNVNNSQEQLVGKSLRSFCSNLCCIDANSLVDTDSDTSYLLAVATDASNKRWHRRRRQYRTPGQRHWLDAAMTATLEFQITVNDAVQSFGSLFCATFNANYCLFIGKGHWVNQVRFTRPCALTDQVIFQHKLLLNGSWESSWIAVRGSKININISNIDVLGVNRLTADTGLPFHCTVRPRVSWLIYLLGCSSLEKVKYLRCPSSIVPDASFVKVSEENAVTTDSQWTNGEEEQKR